MAQWTIIPSSEIETARRSDPEFFKQEYIDSVRMVRRSQGVSLRKLRIKVVSGPFGSSLKSSDYTDSGIPFIRISDLESFSINIINLVFISESSHKRIMSSEIESGDLVLSKVGNSIGIVSILDADFYKANISENNIGIKFPPTAPLALKHFVLSYLNCSFGQNEILRRRSGNAQPKLNVSDVYGLELPMVSQTLQGEVSAIVWQSQTELKKARAIYHQAEELLKAELGLDRLQLEKPVGCISALSECIIHRRIDADYYQMPFRQIDALLDKCSSVQLHTLVDMTKGIEVGTKAYRERGAPFLRVYNIRGETGIELGASDKYIDSELFASLKLYRPEIGEILLTKDGSPGVATVVDEKFDGIVCSGIVRLKLKGSVVPSEYLALVINSQACRMQVDQECSGALIRHWRPSSIRKLRIPILAEPVMQHISNLVTDAKRARRKSHELIEQAKIRVEQLIEEAAQP